MISLRTFSISFLLWSLIGLQGCASKDSITKTNDTLMTQAGFVSGSILHQKDKETPCDYLIKLDEGTLLEPTGLGEEFKKDGLKIWIKYVPSRRMSLCSGSIPANVDEIKIKE
jgi:hypothetical protein